MRKTQIIMSCRRWQMFMQSVYDATRLQLASISWINQFASHLAYFGIRGSPLSHALALANCSYWFKKGSQHIQKHFAYNGIDGQT